MIKIIYCICLMIISLHAFSLDLSNEQIYADCDKINDYETLGDTFFGEKHFLEARKQYGLQAAWSEACDLTDEYLAVAYNNIGMTYAMHGEYLNAYLWFTLKPNEKVSIANLSTFQQKIQQAQVTASKHVEGVYKMYAGQNHWSTISVLPAENNDYLIEFHGYYIGTTAIYTGPNVGSFSTVQPLINGKTHYETEDVDGSEDCRYEITFAHNQVKVVRKAGTSVTCGHGANVVADGIYYKVEDDPLIHIQKENARIDI